MRFFLMTIISIFKIFLILIICTNLVFSQDDSTLSDEKTEFTALQHKVIDKPDTSEQLQSDDTYLSKGKNEFSVWGGFSPDSTTALKFGSGEDARYGVIGVRYARRFNNSDKVNLKYTADFIPFATLNFPLTQFVRIGDTNRFQLETFRRTGYAFGIAPLGIQANFRPRKKLQPFASAGAGFLYFNKNIPNELGKRFNFTLEAGGGIEIGVRNNRAVTVGYKIQHISNAYRGDFNPGYDNNIFYVGYTFFTK